MTRQERAAKQEAALREQLRQQEDAFKEQRAATLKAIARTEQAQRAEAQKARTQRQARVGKALDAAGLFVWDDGTLTAVFQALIPLLDIPDPVALLEGLLNDVSLVKETA